MKWLLVCVVLAAGPADPAASNPLVYKAPPAARLVSHPDSIRWLNPPRENDLFRRFLEWLKRPG
jgi:hypothetical protein